MYEKCTHLWALHRDSPTCSEVLHFLVNKSSTSNNRTAVGSLLMSFSPLSPLEGKKIELMNFSPAFECQHHHNILTYPTSFREFSRRNARNVEGVDMCALDEQWNRQKQSHLIKLFIFHKFYSSLLLRLFTIFWLKDLPSRSCEILTQCEMPL